MVACRWAHQIWPVCIIHKITACERYCNLVVHKFAQTVWMLMTGLFKTPSTVCLLSHCEQPVAPHLPVVFSRLFSVYVSIRIGVPVHKGITEPDVCPVGLSWSQPQESSFKVSRLFWIRQLAERRAVGQESDSRGKVSRLHQVPVYCFSNTL